MRHQLTTSSNPGSTHAPHHRRCAQRILGLVVLGLRVGPVFRQVALADALELEWLLPGRTCLLDGIGGRREQDLNGEGVVPSVQRREPSSRSSAIPDSATRVALARSSAVRAPG